MVRCYAIFFSQSVFFIICSSVWLCLCASAYHSIRNESTKINWNKLLLFGISIQPLQFECGCIPLSFSIFRSLPLKFIWGLVFSDTDQSWTESEFKSSSFFAVRILFYFFFSTVWSSWFAYKIACFHIKFNCIAILTERTQHTYEHSQFICCFCTVQNINRNTTLHKSISDCVHRAFRLYQVNSLFSNVDFAFCVHKR